MEMTTGTAIGMAGRGMAGRSPTTTTLKCRIHGLHPRVATMPRTVQRALAVVREPLLTEVRTPLVIAERRPRVHMTLLEPGSTLRIIRIYRSRHSPRGANFPGIPDLETQVG